MIQTVIVQLKGNWANKEVELNSVLLKPDRSQAVIDHSPDGFNWGYGGSGAAQLALAICLELFGDRGVDFYQEIKNNHIATLPQQDFNENIEMEVDLHEEVSQCECGAVVPVDKIHFGEDGNTCPECAAAFETEYALKDRALVDIGWDHLFAKLNRYEGEWDADDVAQYLINKE